MNKKYSKSLIRHLGIEHLNGRSLSWLSRKYEIPYDSIKEFKKKGFCIRNYKNYEKGHGARYVDLDGYIIPVRRTKVFIGGKPWRVFVISEDFDDSSPLVLGD